ncbi:MAG: lasso peptide biosynthesis B2 protein [Novosphingobium sp.]|nr:lasso peptide biosynthesis B2 protein [Novosphingobium sp.]
MALLCVARLLVALVPLRLWRGSIGRLDGAGQSLATPHRVAAARRLAVHVERAAGRLPFATKCLPRAMALAWLLRKRRWPYVLRIAVRPQLARDGSDDLHAWVECGGRIVIGELPGPWSMLLSLQG